MAHENEFRSQGTSPPSEAELRRWSKISAANKGRTPWNKGLRRCDHPREGNTCHVSARDPGGHCRECCRARRRAGYLRNREKVLARTSNYHRSEAGRVTRSQRDWRRQGHVGATWDTFERLLKKQRGRCAICRCLPSGRSRLHWDHNHTTGATRGAVCFTCNRQLAQYETGVRFTDRKLNEKIRKYLNHHQAASAV
jgi:hypothetical protein